MKKKVSKFYNPEDKWGGPWTEKKLDAFCKYVKSYLLIMQKNPFWKLIYFDGFVGSGEIKKKEAAELYKQLQITEEEEQVYKGSAERILEITEPRCFDHYYFIDKNKSSLETLEKRLRSLSSSDEKSLVFKEGDANKWLIELGNALKSNKKYAALVFLDPFGMQINWESIAALKGTRSDVWILLPTGVIVNRLLDKKGELPLSTKLEEFFGISKEEIHQSFYKKVTQQTIFGEEIDSISKVSRPIEKIAELYANRLKTIWEHVTDKPLRLENTHGTPLFHFVFASNNKAAKNIANDIISKI